MLELIGTLAPGRNPGGKENNPGGVGAGLDFAKLLRHAEEEHSPMEAEAGLPKSFGREDTEDASGHEDAGGEPTVSTVQDDEREESVEQASDETTEEDVMEEASKAAEQAEGVVAVALEVDIKQDSEPSTISEGEGEEIEEAIFIAPQSSIETESGDEAPLDGGTDDEVESEITSAPMANFVEAKSPLELLNFSELMDPDLVVEKNPDQVISRISQAVATSTAAPLQEELAETVMPQVVRGIATLIRNGGAEMRLQLKPVDLGEIELRVRTAEGVVRGEMMVQNPEVKQLLDDQIDRLRTALASQGLELDGFDVNVDRDPRFARDLDPARQGERIQGAEPGGDDSSGREVPVAVSLGEHAVDFTT